jgi:hypothetical protein
LESNSPKEFLVVAVSTQVRVRVRVRAQRPLFPCLKYTRTLKGDRRSLQSEDSFGFGDWMFCSRTASLFLSRPIVSRSVHKQKANEISTVAIEKVETVGVVLRLQAHTIQPILEEATRRLTSFQSLRRANLCSLLIETNLRGLQSIYP